MANTRPKDHHFIPEMHLKHFADAQGMVWTYHKANGKITPTAPRETGVWRNFYAVEREPGLYFDDLEGCLSAVESDATPIYEKLLLGEIPRGRDRGIFAWFIGTMYARTPGMIRMCAEAKGSRLGMQIAMLTTSREKFKEVMDEAEEEELGPFDPQIRDRVFELLNDPRKYTINVDRSAGLEALGIANDMAEIFCRMGWCLLQPKDKSDFFITSDHPVTQTVPERSHSFEGDGSFMNPKARVTLPLSPDRLLIMTWGQDTPSGVIPIPRQLVHLQNEQRAFFAEAQVYADRRDAGMQALAEKYKDQRAEIDLSGFGADRRVKVKRKIKPDES
jgi:hypothetical protein